ncbi:MAG: RagB/SusD family nutrient uptake outer membrane protein [Mucilaginibacter sp.]|nr:RagB/SusD family nutrient uptake outer membrane protein [Mucilaginibacter sp.]
MKKIFSNKNRILAGGLLIAFSTLASCKKLIEIPANPPTQITRAQAFADSATAISAVAGVYTYTVSSNNNGIPYYSGYYDVATALSGNEVSYTSTEDDGQFNSYNLNAKNSHLNDLWTTPYAEIYQVNDVLAGITNNSHLSASFIKQVTGEMEVVRAFVYFYQANLFGGLPLVTTTDYKISATLPRSSRADVYKQVLTDLNNATTKLTADYASYPATYTGGPLVSSGHARPNLYTAVALKAKVNLYLGNWQAAYTEADSVIQHGGFTLESDPNKIFLDGSAEAIWQVPILDSYSGSGDARNFVPYGGTPAYPVTDSLLNSFEPGDLRKSDWLAFNVVGGKNVYYPFKYKDKAPTTPATGFVLLRFAEMYLIRAEAAIQLNNNLNVVVADINAIRQRAGLAPATVTASSSQTALLAAVRQERRIELCFEFGNRFFDLSRTAGDNKYPITGQAPAVLAGWQPDFSIYPVPQTQIELNNTLVQNPGYQ